jgi:hypothetical protein
VLIDFGRCRSSARMTLRESVEVKCASAEKAPSLSYFRSTSGSDLNVRIFADVTTDDLTDSTT